MANENTALEVKKEEMLPAEGSERTRETRCFVPRADIFETDEKIVVKVDLPGVSENSTDITLEKNVLTINGYVEGFDPEGYSLAFAEYESGDFERSFRISNEIDCEKINATIKNGVLTLELPKSEVAKSRKIKVKAS
jgi:HSP20 family protein